MVKLFKVRYVEMMVRVWGWGMYNVYKSPHKDRKMHICVMCA